MVNDQIIRGRHFTCLHTGRKEEWSHYGVERLKFRSLPKASGSCVRNWIRRAWSYP